MCKGNHVRVCSKDSEYYSMYGKVTRVENDIITVYFDEFKATREFKTDCLEVVSKQLQ